MTSNNARFLLGDMSGISDKEGAHDILVPRRTPTSSGAKPITGLVRLAKFRLAALAGT